MTYRIKIVWTNKKEIKELVNDFIKTHPDATNDEIVQIVADNWKHKLCPIGLTFWVLTFRKICAKLSKLIHKFFKIKK